MPVEGLGLDPFTLWVVRLSHPPDPSVEAVRVHHRVVQDAARSGVTPVPFRFGQWFASREELDEALQERGEALASALERLADTEEFGVRILEPRPVVPGDGAMEAASGEVDEGGLRLSRPGPGAGSEPGGGSGGDAPPGGPGRAYLEQLHERRRAGLERERRARRLGEALAESLGDTVLEQKVEPLLSPHGVASVAHLLRTRDRDRYLERLETFRRGHEGLKFLRSGPWPPYSFGP